MGETALARTNQNVSNVLPRYYMNVGSWGDHGKSDIALISGNDLVLASWIGDTLDQQQFANTAQKTAINANPKLKSFFEAAAKKKRGFINRVKAVKCTEKVFTEEGELIIIIGDCHINLLREWGPDNFVRIPTPGEMGLGRARVSMWNAMEEFINFASGQTTPENLIHIGDLYDIWEAQNIFEHGAFVLQSLMRALNPVALFNLQFFNGSRPSQPIDKELPGHLLSRKKDYESGKAKDFAWLKHRKIKLSEGQKVAIYLARYFGIEDPPQLPAPKITYEYEDYGNIKRSIKMLEAGSPYFAEHRKWCDQVQQKYYEKRPSLRDALALIFYGIGRTGTHGLGDSTLPFSFSTSNAWYEFNTSWNDSNIGSFFGQCGNLKMVDEPCDFLSCEKIKEMIKAQYHPPTFDKLNCRVGNHDISETDEGGKYKNHYLDMMFKQGLAFEDVKAALDATAVFDAQGEPSKNQAKAKNRLDDECDLDDKYLTHRCGINEQVVIEHGHVWDVYNNPQNYSLFFVNHSKFYEENPLQSPNNEQVLDKSILGFTVQALDGGYHACRTWTVGTSYTSSPVYDGDMNDPTWYFYNLWKTSVAVVGEGGKRLVSPQADYELALACEERMNGIFEKNPQGVTLVVMGHTHNPFIMSWGHWINTRPNTSALKTTLQGIGKANSADHRSTNESRAVKVKPQH